MAKNVFNSVQYPKIGSNTFDLSHDVKLSFKMGSLIPSFVMDCVPGDRVRLSSETMLRFAPLISPVMHRVNVTTHYFFVPNRLLWSNWEKWITGELEVEAPYIASDSWQEYGVGVGTVGDYLGYPAGQENIGNVKMSALPVAAYNLIYSEYYRDQNLQDSNAYKFFPLQNGDNSTIYGQLLRQIPRRRSWQHDYFTAALPFAQKGDAVTLPLFTGDTDIPIVANPLARPGQIVRNNSTNDPLNVNINLQTREGFGGYLYAGSTAAYIDPNGSMVARIEDVEAEAADINTLRRAFRLQEWLERNARGGTRYIENILAHFGVKSSDARLNRPEFLGGSYQKMVISEVLSTAETDIPVGNLAGHGISVGSGKEFTYYCEEHGWIIGIINVQPVTAYQQGLPRMFSREDRLEYYWPSFANIGEQEVKNKEIYVSNDGLNEDTFGYVPRYAEYKYIPSRVAGEMRTSLSQWHLGRIFENRPNLNANFIQADPSTRIFAVTEGVDHIYGHIFNNCRALRKMPKFGTPQI